MMFPPFPRARRAAAGVFSTLSIAGIAAPSAHAQSQPPVQTADAAGAVQRIVITGNPLGSDEITAPVSTLSGTGLVLRRASTLGETLDGLPGVSSSYFGPNANRPVIRGQDGDRIRVLSNAGASLDASSLSNDHAVPIDPLVVERIEVLRGPAALLYGGSAVGGVVNAIDNRIPRSRLDGVSGSAEVRFGGPASEQGASALVEGGGSGFAWHADGFWRSTDDLKVPTFDRPDGEGGSTRSDTVINSASRARGGAAGGSMVWDHGFLGLSVDTYRNRYGTVAEEDVSIAMQRDRTALAGEVRALAGPIEKVSGQVAYTDYEHIEFEGPEVGTTFRNRGTDGRVELTHRRVDLGGGSALAGVFGLQVEDARFSALGAEAFVPTTTTRSVAAFLFEEWSAPFGKLTFGVRGESVRVSSAGDAPDAEEPTFGAAASRRFRPGSAAVGALWNLSPQWQLTGNLAYTERAPTFYELYANGVHVATAAYERGDPQMALEKASNLDVALQWKAAADGVDRVRVGAFASRYANYIVLANTGDTFVDPEEGAELPVYAYRGVPARLWGVEAEGAVRLLRAPLTLDLDGKVDWVRGVDRDSGEALPRLAPMRLTVGLDASIDRWQARAEVIHAARQDRVPADDLPTDSYTLVNLSLNRAFQFGPFDALGFLKLTNVTNELAYNAATVQTVRVLSPLPGRGAMAGLRVAF